MRRDRAIESAGSGLAALLVAALFIATLPTVGCSHVLKIEPMPNERQGLLDHLSSLQPAGLGVRPDEPYEEVESGEVSDARSSARDWAWPLKKVQVTSEYGKRDGRFHEGIDLRAGLGTSVHAVADGEVAFAGRLSGYGRMVVVRHKGGLYSLYAHHSKNLVSKGASIRRGQKIALSGNSGRSSGPHLHFEVRRGVAAVDPLRILPARGTVALFR
jgi:murein DD-endopeptidase MepM/ murein hydrolase activator NlpD